VGSSTSAIAAFAPLRFDVLISDIHLPERPNGVELATILRAQDPGLALVFVSNYPSTEAFTTTVKPPAPHAYLQKDLLDSPETLVKVVESALDDSQPPHLLIKQEEHSLSGLTATQLQVVRLVAEGYTNAEIARMRSTNQRAVEKMLHRIFHQLGISSDPARTPRVVLANMYNLAYRVSIPVDPA